MNILERISNGIGSGKVRGIYEESDGRHFCTQCGKLMRPGQECIDSWGPAFRRRETVWHYSHYPECPLVKSKVRQETEE